MDITRLKKEVQQTSLSFGPTTPKACDIINSFDEGRGSNSFSDIALSG